MPKARVLLVASAAAFALAATLVDTASANWFIEGKELASGSAAVLSSKALADALLELNMPAIKIKVGCEGPLVQTEKSEIIGTDTLKAAKLLFEGCKTIEPTTNCTISETTIATQPLTATGSDKSTLLTFTPQTKKILAEIPFSTGNTCALEGLQPLKGAFGLKTYGSKIEGAGSLENNSLEVGSGNKAFFERGLTELELASSKAWYFQPADKPAVDAVPIAGAGRAAKRPNCAFKNKGDKCEVEVIVTQVPGNALKFVGDKFVKLRSPTIEYAMAKPANNECTKGTVIPLNTPCKIAVEYTGGNAPGKGKYVSGYLLEVEENGPPNLKDEEIVVLETEER